MSEGRIRRRVAFEAARLIFEREERGNLQSKRKAARRFRGEAIRRRDLPSDREIREHIGEVARMIEAKRLEEPAAFGPTIAGEVTKMGQAPHGESFCTDPNSIGSEPVPFFSDRFRIYELLLGPLENVKENLDIHPEGDALYHSLQVFELARVAIPYDEEFLLAALLHDVGKAIDPRDHIAAGLEALDGAITARTSWLIEHHLAAQSLKAGTLGVRFRHRLEADESFEELMLLAECDRRGRAVGMHVPEVQEAIRYLRELAAECGE
jgi:hypothetical protein